MFPRKLKCDLFNINRRPLMFYRYIWLLFVSFVGFCFYFYPSIFCSDSLDISIIKKLRQEVYGQDEAITSIENAMRSEDNVKIIAFIGGTGHGKTYTSLILKNSLQHGAQNVVTLTLENIDAFDLSLFQDAAFVCNFGLLIIDDLTFADLNTIVQFIKDITEDTEYHRLDIILIFNEDVFVDETKKRMNIGLTTFINSYSGVLGIPIHIAKFYEMDNCYIKMCAKNALKILSIPETEKNINQLMNLVEPDIKGCKQIYPKALLLYGRKKHLVYL